MTVLTLLQFGLQEALPVAIGELHAPMYLVRHRLTVPPNLIDHRLSPNGNLAQLHPLGMELSMSMMQIWRRIDRVQIDM
jgi:hypothetical protein